MENILFDVKGAVALVTLNRPQALNALNGATLQELGEVLDQINVHDDIRAVVVTGAGRAFVAGADITEMKEYTPTQAKAFSLKGNEVFLKLEQLSKPVIAAVNGFALGGGCELAMACDIRMAGEKAKFALPEVGLGITPGFGGTQRLPRLIGQSLAMELTLTNQMINAQEALSYGLVSHVDTQEELMDKAMELAETIAARPRVAVCQAKSAIRRGAQTDIATATAFEAEAFALCFSTQDQTTAMTAFVEKRKVEAFDHR